MALNIQNDTLASAGAGETSLPMFNVERVQLNFNIASDFVAGQVANNVLILALATNRILRIDLENPSDIDGALRVCQSLYLTDFQQTSIYRSAAVRLDSSGACSSILQLHT